MVDTYWADLKYHPIPKYRINFQSVLNVAYSCPSSIDYVHWSLKQSQIQYQHQKVQDKRLLISTNIARCNHLTLHWGM